MCRAAETTVNSGCMPLLAPAPRSAPAGWHPSPCESQRACRIDPAAAAAARPPLDCLLSNITSAISALRRLSSRLEGHDLIRSTALAAGCKHWLTRAGACRVFCCSSQHRRTPNCPCCATVVDGYKGSAPVHLHAAQVSVASCTIDACTRSDNPGWRCRWRCCCQLAAAADTSVQTHDIRHS